MQSAWSYECDDLVPIVNLNDFKEGTEMSLLADNSKILAKLNAASAAVRAYCGWHVSPNLECTYVGQAEGNLITLPLMHITDIISVSIGGAELDESLYEWLGGGLIRTHFVPTQKWRAITVKFKAGYEQLDDVSQAVIQLTENALVANPGIREEHADGVGATYNATDRGVSGGVRLLQSDRELLRPYKMVSV